MKTTSSEVDNIMHHFGFSDSQRSEVEAILSEHEFDTAVTLLGDLVCKRNDIGIAAKAETIIPCIDSLQTRLHRFCA